MTRASAWFTPSGVRLRAAKHCGDGPDWLLLPGGPGLGAESLAGLAACMEVPGTLWLVDLPGDGSNVQPAPECYRNWPDVLIEAVQALLGAVLVGHSTGGMYALSVPALAPLLRGLVLISSAPDATWQAGFSRMVADHPLPQATSALACFAAAPGAETLREAMLASAPWSFLPAGLPTGRALFEQLPYNPAAMAWSAEHFDAEYRAAWWPQYLPVLIVSGAEDRVVDQALWDDESWQTTNVMQVVVEGAGHFPWVEQPAAVGAALADFAANLVSG
jgi:pimeloyl-ACP methyl ester carboxylesterase